MVRQRLIGRCYLLYYRENKVKYPRLGIVASKRKIKKAVSRNRIKRVVKEAFRMQKSRLPSFDVVVIAKLHSLEVDNQELYECIKKLFGKLKKQSKRSFSI